MELNRRVGPGVYGNRRTLPADHDGEDNNNLTVTTFHHLEDTERLPMADPLRAPSIDREDSISFLDPTVTVRQASSDHLVHLKENIESQGYTLMYITIENCLR